METTRWHDIERDREIGSQLRSRRQSMSPTLKDLAQRTGMSDEQLRKYEHGIDAIKASALERLAAELAIPITYFYESPLPKTDWPYPSKETVIDLARKIGSIEDAEVREAIGRTIERASQTTLYISLQ
ncbi:MAG: helix-turn-helix transcriptional regulator [Rhizobiaceae bacterium]